MASLEVASEEEAKSHDNAAMLKADRAHANDSAFHQLVPIVVVWKLLQLFGGDDPFSFGHGVPVAHGILASSLRRPCQLDCSGIQKDDARQRRNCHDTAVRARGFRLLGRSQSSSNRAACRRRRAWTPRLASARRRTRRRRWRRIGNAAILRALFWPNERRFNLVPEFRIHRLRAAQRRLARDAVEPRQFID